MPHAAGPIPVGCLCRHGRCRGTEARADRRIARLALARPPARGIRRVARSRDARLLREAGGCAISLLAAGQDWLAQHFARGFHRSLCGTASRPKSARAARLARGSAGLAGVLDPRRGGCRDAHVLRMRRSAKSSAAKTRLRSFVSGATTGTVIEAVIFDLDGVLIDSEHVWDDVRREFARERGGRWSDRAQTRHDGHELDRVVALRARRLGVDVSRRRRSTPRWCAGSGALRRELPLLAGAVRPSSGWRAPSGSAWRRRPTAS